MTDVVERVMQLVRLAVDKGATNEEGRSAAAKACELIAKHKLRIVDDAARTPSRPPPRASAQRVEVEIDFADILNEIMRNVRRGAPYASEPPRRPPPPPPPPPPSEPEDGWVWHPTVPRAYACLDCGGPVLSYHGGYVKPGVGTVCFRCGRRRGAVR